MRELNFIGCLQQLANCCAKDFRIYQKNAKQNDDKIKALMQKQIVGVQAEKGISDYRIYKALNLNPGNVKYAV